MILGVYRPPSSKVGWFNTAKDLILETLSYGPTIIMGDINADLFKPLVYPGKALLEVLSLAGTSVKEVFPTRITATSKSCIDIIALPHHLDCSLYEVGSSAASDHFPVQAKITGRTRSKVGSVFKRSYRTINYDRMKTLVANISIDHIHTDNPDIMLTKWHNSMLAILDQVAPLKPFPRKRKKPMTINSDIRFLLDQRKWLAKEVQKDPNNSKLKEELRIARRKVKSNIRRLQKVRGGKMLNENDTKAAWKFIREVTFTVKKDPPNSVDPVSINNFFATTVQASSPTVLQVPQSCDSNDCFNINNLSNYKVERMLTNLKVDTATGPDDLPAFLLKDLAKEIAPNISLIMNSSINSGIFPQLWKKANVTAVWKNKGSKTDPANFRPISILPVLARMMEKEIARQLSTYCTSKEIIPQQQFGFRAKSSCEVALLHSLDGWMQAIDKGDMVGALLVDLSKAFDMVPHQKLIMELAAIGCGMSSLAWFASYLSDRFQRVVQPPIITEWMPVTRGAPQGGGLSPLFFNTYVKDLPTVIQSQPMQFADDLTVSEQGRDIQQIGSSLSHTFQDIKSYCEDRELIVNASKTQLIIFKVPARKVPADFQVSLDNCVIKPASSVKLLGVILDKHFTFGEHIDSTVKKCHGILGSLTRASSFLSRDLRKLAYTALVRSRLEYCSAIFASASCTQLRKLDTVQKIASRIICGAARNTHSAPLLEALNLESLDKRRTDHIISLVDSIISENCHPALLNMFTVLQNGKVSTDQQARIGIGKRRFSVFAPGKYNCSMI